ncbi:MAG TPA: dodecin family protein [Acetobacteraceae bacterium]|jgi:flavin-binding protein dodecin|nr:dodecin family protein [Acetobacteraceae bacterium]
MAIIRNIYVTARSEMSFDDACQTVVKEVTKTLRGIMSFKVCDTECVVEHDSTIAYRVPTWSFLCGTAMICPPTY